MMCPYFFGYSKRAHSHSWSFFCLFDLSPSKIEPFLVHSYCFCNHVIICWCSTINNVSS
jgi:hypothetical protein